MARALIVNNRGEVEVDPFDRKGHFERWLESIRRPGGLDYYSIKAISAAHSEAITRYVLDLALGKNTARGHRKGPRSFVHLMHARYHLTSLLRILERQTGKISMDFSEDEILLTFRSMRAGKILNQKGKAFLDVSTYAKVFAAFWRWYMRTQLQVNGQLVPEVVQNLDTSADHKPAWHHFTIQDVERMADIAPRYEYRALVYFLFDSGIRAPKELMNVRVMDLEAVPGAPHFLLTIREETSKTFGRKIKLMLSSEILRRYIELEKLQPKDFIFTRCPTIYNRMLAKFGHKIKGFGTEYNQYKNGKVNKTLVKGGITMYDFRHNSVCHYLPIYKSENQLKYRYGWKKADMIHYYSEFIGMRDTITDDDLLVDTTKGQLEQQLSREQQKRALLAEQFRAREQEMEERIKNLEASMLQQFADKFKP